MKIAAIQHAHRLTPAADLEALVAAAAAAAARGAACIVLPDVVSLHAGPLGDELFRRVERDAGGVIAIAAHDASDAGYAFADVPRIGRVVILNGDACCDSAYVSRAAADAPGVVVLAPASESDLQAQAILELAVALSTSVASLVIIAETDGAEPGSPGHGGSAIIHLGEVRAEALFGDDLLIDDVPAPLGPPEAPTAMPQVPPLLAQRLAAHQGRKLDVEYPADLG